jgi:glycosyltransferase involved in cell wall biosynthesis
MGDTTCKWLFYGHPRDMYRTAVMRLQQTYPDKVEFRGFQLSERIYREIDILINPSTQFDPLPTTLIEAARHGIPAVASDLGGAREIVEHEVTGYMFDVNRPIAGLCGLRELAKDESRRSAMGQAARRVFEERFGVARMAKEYARFWNGSLEGRGIESDRFGS